MLTVALPAPHCALGAAIGPVKCLFFPLGCEIVGGWGLLPEAGNLYFSLLSSSKACIHSPTSSGSFSSLGHPPVIIFIFIYIYVCICAQCLVQALELFVWWPWLVDACAPKCKFATASWATCKLVVPCQTLISCIHRCLNQALCVCIYTWAMKIVDIIYIYIYIHINASASLLLHTRSQHVLI